MLQLIKRENYIGGDRNKTFEEFQKIVNDYKAEIENMNIDQCKAEEERLLNIMKEHDEIMLNVAYDLPKSCTFAGSPRVITRKTIGEYINEFLEKVECEYQYTLGYFELYQWWKDPQSTITYNVLNSTLQVLGNNNMRFRGPHQWQMILTINEYFKALHDSYIVDNMITHLYSVCHSMLLDKMKIDNPIESQPTVETTTPIPDKVEVGGVQSPSFEESQGEHSMEPTE